jgi:hypothetical protein
MPEINLKSSNEEIVNTFFKDITCDDYQESIFKGGQSFADKALNNLDINGYAKKRNNVYPTEKRGSSYLSPYIYALNIQFIIFHFWKPLWQRVDPLSSSLHRYLRIS